MRYCLRFTAVLAAVLALATASWADATTLVAPTFNNPQASFTKTVLAWNPVQVVENGVSVPLVYQVSRDGVVIGITGATSYTDSAFTPYTHHTWQVAAKTLQQIGPQSAPFDNAFLFTPLPAPNNVSVIPSVGKATISWSPVISPLPYDVKYFVYRNNQRVSPALGTASYSDGNLDPGAYSWSVSAAYALSDKDPYIQGIQSAAASATINYRCFRATNDQHRSAGRAYIGGGKSMVYYATGSGIFIGGSATGSYVTTLFKDLSGRYAPDTSATHHCG